MTSYVERRSAFTLVELLTVIGILALLLALVLPGLAKARDRADEALCINNARQVVVAWTLYRNDHNERIPPNVDGLLGGFTNWVAGHMGERVDATNTLLLIDSRRSLLSPYLKQPEVFKCPSDETEHVRTISMNCRLNPTRYVGVQPRWVGGNGAKYRTFRSLTDIAFPDRIFVTLDEHPASINDAYFAVDLSHTGTPDGMGTERPFYMIDYPADHHSGGATVSFVDGHIAIHKWTDPNTLMSLRVGRHIPPPNEDVEWLHQHSTYLK